MTPLFKKLNLGTQSSILVLNSPESFEGELQRLDGVQIRKKATAKTKSSFSIAFAVTQKELDRLSATLIQSAEEDAILWVAYPKEPRRSTSASSTATRVGPFWAELVMNRSVWLQSMTTGRRSDFDWPKRSAPCKEVIAWPFRKRGSNEPKETNRRYLFSVHHRT